MPQTKTNIFHFHTCKIQQTKYQIGYTSEIDLPIAIRSIEQTPVILLKVGPG